MITAGEKVVTVTESGGSLSASYKIWVKPAAQSPLLVVMPNKVNYVAGGSGSLTAR
jgi:hypothetical protein